MRYLKLLAIFYKNCLLTDLEYRANFVMNLLTSVFWVGFSLIGIGVFFHQRATIGSWNYDEALLVVGLFVLFEGLIDSLFTPNIQRMVEEIRLGTFDFVLTRPVNSQFLATLRYFSPWKLANVAMGAAICRTALNRLQVGPSLAQLAAGSALMASAVVIAYSLWLLMLTTAFWFVRIDNITELFWAVYETGRFPVSVYPGWLQGVLSFVIPVAFITTFPAAAVLGKVGAATVFEGLALAAALFTASTLFWRFALRHYSSASS